MRSLPRLLGASVLWLVLLALLLRLPPALPSLWWAVGLMVVLSELWAPPVRQFGFFSVSAPMVMVLVRAPGAAGFVLTLALVLRSLRHGRPELPGRWLEAASDALPALVALDLVARWPRAAVPAAVAWLALSQTVPTILSAGLSSSQTMEWLRARELLRGAQFGLAFPLALFPYLADWQALALFPALFGLQSLARQPGATRTIERLGRDLEEEKARALEARQGQEKMRQLALRRADELAGLERLTRSLTTNEALELTLEAVLGMVLRVAPNARSAVLFLRQEGALQPVALRTPHQDRVRDAVLLKLREPVIEEVARAGGTTAYHTESEGEGRVFPGELSLAIALGGEGVLYVGTTDADGFSDETREFLAVVAGQAVVALQSARRMEAERQARAQHEAARGRLERWVQRLGRLLDGSARLTSTLDPDELARRLEAMLREVVPHQVGMAVFHDGPVHLWGGASREAALELSQTIMTNARPLLLERRRDARLPPLSERSESLVSVPLLVESTCVGAIGLSCPEESAFGREDQDLLQMVGYLTAVAFANTRRQVQLAQANKLAAVGQLAAGVAHELNSPLGAILLAAESALMKPQAAATRLERIQQATLRAQKIVSNLLIYCQGGQLGPAEPVDLASVVEQALDIVPLQAERSLRPGLEGLGNAGQVLQVLTNLLSNARDAGAQAVRLESWREGDRVFLAVHDNGSGVPDELTERIFEPFFTTRPVGHGTGLGLAICHQLLTMQDGTIELVRDGRPGARFVVSLPGV